MPDDAPAPAALSAALAGVRRVRAVVNAASGGVNPGAARQLEALLAERGLEAQVADSRPGEIEPALREAIDARPDLLIVLAGDGTARLACQMAGPDGPVVAPLPGGTMNMLPFALFGRRPWPDALAEALDRGEVKPVSAGEVDGELFFCAAIVGAPALWQPAREAVRKGRLRQAWRAARVALGRAFSRRIRYRLDGGTEQKAEALSVMCPLVSRVMSTDEALDVAALNPRGAADALRLGARTLLTDVLGDWRRDSAVDASPAREVRLHARRRRIPAVLDGEARPLPRDSMVRHRPAAFRALHLPEVDAASAAAPERQAQEGGAAVGPDAAAAPSREAGG